MKEAVITSSPTTALSSCFPCPVSRTVRRSWARRLRDWGFPLFRYRTGDEVGPTDSGPCSCGRSFERVGSIDGRVEDTFLAADGRPLPLPSVILDDLVGVHEFQVVQLSAGRFEVRVVPGAAYDKVRTTTQIRHNVNRQYGAGQTVTIRTLSALPRPASGKLRVSVVAGR